MAKQQAEPEVNKSEEIRAYLKENPGASPKEVSQALNDRGIEVSAAYVSTIKSSSKKKGGGGGGGRRGRGARAAGDPSMAMLEDARKLADQLGGVHQAKRIFDFLSSLAQ